MSEAKIHPIVMPKWGLSMSEGRVGDWQVKAGAEIRVGDDLLDVETDKIAGSVEAVNTGVVRRLVAKPDTVLPVGALLGVLSEGEVSDAEIDAFVTDFQAHFVPPDEEEGEGESAYQTVEAGGYRLRYAKRGDGGESVVLVHGFGGDLDNWLFNLDDLASGHTVYAFDLPGHGESSKAVGDVSLAGLAQVLSDFMAALNIEQAHLIGHSLGGAVIQQLAVEQPARVRSLSLICSAGLGTEINREYIDGFIAARGRRDTKQVLQHLFADQSLVTRQMVDDILKYKRLDGVPDALRSIADAVFAEGVQQAVFREQLDDFGVPVLAIWGGQDRIIPLAHCQGLPANITVEVFDNAGHMVQMEAAGEVNKRIKAHLAAA